MEGQTVKEATTFSLQDTCMQASLGQKKEQLFFMSTFNLIVISRDNKNALGRPCFVSSVVSTFLSPFSEPKLLQKINMYFSISALMITVCP